MDIPQSLWIVLDSEGRPEFAAGWREAAHEHIKDAIEIEVDETASQWVVREYVPADELTRLRAEDARLRKECSKENDDICQTLGRALKYPKFVDDQAAFPGAAEADGVCVGDHVAASLACEAADEIGRLRAEVEALRADALKQVDCRQCKHATNRGCHSTALCERGELFEATPPWQFYDAARAAQGGET